MNTPHHATIRTLSGITFDYLAPDFAAVPIGDIIEALHGARRWFGHHPHRWNGLTHSAQSFKVCQALGGSDLECRTALFHDVHEAVIGDVPSPLKRAMRAYNAEPRSPFDYIENACMVAVADEWQTLYPLPDIVKQADAICLSWEAHQRTSDPHIDLYGPVPADIAHMLDSAPPAWGMLGEALLLQADVSRRHR